MLKDKHFEQYSNMLIRYRWAVIATCVILSIAASMDVKHIKFNTNYRVFFSEENPQLNAFDAFQKIFTKTDSIIIVIKPKTGDIFNQQHISLIQHLTEAVWKVPYTSKVDSITNFQHTYATNDELIVTDLFDIPGTDLSQADIAGRRQIAVNDPLLKNRLISPSGETTAINLTLQLPGKDRKETPTAVNEVRRLVALASERHPELHFALSGTVMMNQAFAESAMQDLKTLVPVMYLVLITMMFAFLRSIAGTIACVIIIVFSTAVAMGLTGWFGMELTSPSATAPTIILTLAIADSIHFLNTFFKEMANGQSKRQAIKESLRLNLLPIFLTSITTTIGFLSLNFSDVPPFRDLGNITAMGIIAAFLLSISLLPALMSVLPVSRRTLTAYQSNLVTKLAYFSIKHPKTILVSLGGTVLVLFISMFNLELDDQFVRYFDESVAFRADTDFMNTHLTGVYQVEFPVAAGGPNGINSPSYLNHLESFSAWLSEQPKVTHVYSIVDIIKRLNKNLHNDNEDHYQIPHDKESAAQYLLLYELSLPYGLDLTDRIDISKGISRVSVTIEESSSKEARDFELKARNWLKQNTPDYMHTQGTSPSIMFAHISERNIKSMIKGNLTAFILISLCIGLALRSAKFGLLSLIPNLFPAIMAFGTWSILIGQVNMAVATVAAVSLGIIVDDTVHILSKYRQAKHRLGLSCEDAIIHVFATCGNALWMTTIILIAGFSVLCMSTFTVNGSMGLLNAIAIGFALVVDFLLLPVLLLTFDREK